MSFLETVRRARELLREEGRISLRALALELELDDARLESLVDELVDVQQVAAREGKVLAWIGPATPESSTARAEAPTTAPEPDAERRQLTVVFCDLVGSVEWSQRLDAEDWRTVLRAYQDTVAGVVTRFGGYVAQYLGDGVLAYFGYPRAHEDEAERAIRAARDVVLALDGLNERIEPEHGARLAVRIGIHTGPVVVGSVGPARHDEKSAVGATPNVAARLQGLAEPGAVVISAATQRLVAGIFELRDLGTPELKGVNEPIRVYQVIRPSGVRSRLDRAARLTPFVGREHEVGLLLDRFEQVREGRGQAVLVSGEPGIGKSRVVHELRERLRETPYTWLECGGSPFAQSSALQPVIELVEHGHHFADAGSDAEKLSRLERGLEHAGLALGPNVPLLASLLSLPLPERYPALGISPQLQRQRTLEALRTWTLALGGRQPVLLVMEDLHWFDPTTVEWLGMLIEQLPTSRVLLVTTARPVFEVPSAWRTETLALGRLVERDARRLAGSTLVEEALPEPLLDEIAARSDGVPLFVEELARSVGELRVATTPLDRSAIPETLQDLLAARLDRLGEARQVAQVAAVLGREFPYALLAAVAPVSETAVQQALARLAKAELLYGRGTPPDASYSFKHALVQDAAYRSLLKDQRRALHGRVLDALETHFPERVESDPALLAHHCAAAGRTPQAVAHHARAGQRAVQRFAHREAVDHLRQGIALLETLPDTIERNQQEIRLQCALAGSLYPTEGAREVERAYARALALLEETPESPELVQPLIFASLFHFVVRTEFETSRELAERALRLAEGSHEVYPELVAHTRLGITLMHTRELSAADRHLERAMALYDPPAHRPLAAAWAQDWGVAARIYAAMNKLLLGYPDQARQLQRDTDALIGTNDPYSRAAGLTGSATLYRQLRDPLRTRECAEEALEIGGERGLPLVVAFGNIELGWAIGGPGGVPLIEEGLAQLESMGSRVYLYERAALVDLHLALGRFEDARGALDRTPRSFAAEWDQLHGELLRRTGSSEEAERSLRRAMALSREKQARFWELRAATSLARLLRDQGRGDEARELLAPVYAWFNEGFDTPDLKDARALLDELA